MAEVQTFHLAGEWRILMTVWISIHGKRPDAYMLDRNWYLISTQENER